MKIDLNLTTKEMRRLVRVLRFCVKILPMFVFAGAYFVVLHYNHSWWYYTPIFIAQMAFTVWVDSVYEPLIKVLKFTLRDMEYEDRHPERYFPER